MSAFPKGFNKFEFSKTQEASLRSNFVLLLSETDLSQCSKIDRIITDYKQMPGIYFWVMRHNERLFRIYIGKTKNVSYRLTNYVSEFQPHSPNDYKIRIFRAYLAEVVPGATLDLYFFAKDIKELTHAEKAAIDTFDPLLNRRQRPSTAARKVLQDAFALYYRSAFEQSLKNDQIGDSRMLD